MKKQYIKPILLSIAIEMEPLMTLSSNSENPQTQMNPNPYNGNFGARDFAFDEEYEDEEVW